MQADGEVVVDETSGFHVGDRASLGPLPVEVVGLTKDTTMFAGLPVVFTELDAAQDFTFHSRDLVSAFLTDAMPTTVPDGVAVHSAGDVAADALSPLGNAISSIDLVRALLWFVTAVIIGAVVFLSALERQRDFAILRAMGTPRRTLLIGVATEAALIALARRSRGLRAALGDDPAVPAARTRPARALWQIPLGAVVAALVAGAFGLRKVATADPASAFGGR